MPLSVAETSLLDVAAKNALVAVLVNPDDALLDAAIGSGLFQALQLHGDETPHDVERLMSRGVNVIKALQVRDAASLPQIGEFPCTAILLDAYNPGTYGGGGHAFPWELAVRAQEDVSPSTSCSQAASTPTTCVRPCSRHIPSPLMSPAASNPQPGDQGSRASCPLHRRSAGGMGVLVPPRMLRYSHMHPVEQQILLKRREFMATSANGIGALALGALLTEEGLISRASAMDSGGVIDPLTPKAGHFPAKAKNCIFIFFEGGPSQMDLFDPKPRLNELNGQALPESLTKNVRFAFIRKETAKLMGSPRKFAKHGQCGMDFSDLLPHMAKHADDWLMIRSLHTDQFNHHPGQLVLHCGRAQFGLPTIGSWLNYGLGSMSRNLPGYVVLSAGRGTSGGASLWQSGFLPSTYAGVLFRNQGEPVLNLKNPPGIPMNLQRKGLDTLMELNQSRYEHLRDPEIASRIAAYELAFRMQSSAPELIDLKDESPQTLEMYGVNRKDPPIKASRGGGPGQYQAFAKNCLLARRLVERGVRFVSLMHEREQLHELATRHGGFMGAKAHTGPVGGLLGIREGLALLSEGEANSWARCGWLPPWPLPWVKLRCVFLAKS
jgi:hypothetical protein